MKNKFLLFALGCMFATGAMAQTKLTLQLEKAEKTGVRFAVFGEKCFDFEITEDDVSDVLLTNKDKWERLKAFWH